MMKKLINQIIAATSCSLVGFSGGLAVGWIAPALPQLLSDSQPVGEITLEQSTWIASAIAIPPMITIAFVALLSEYYGRKTCLLLSNIPFAINGCLVIIANNVTLIIIGRLFAGIACTLILGNVSAYIGEIASSNVRGSLASLFTLLYTLGMTIAYAVVGFIGYVAGGWAMLIIAIINFILLLFMPETPAFLVKVGKYEKAHRALSWLRQVPLNDAELKKELEDMKQSLISEKPSIIESAKKLLISKPLRQGFFMCFLIFFTLSLSGMFIMHSYSVSIFTDGGNSKLSSELAAVIYGSIQVFGAFTSLWLVDVSGRKILFLISCFGVSICNFIMGTYFYLKNDGYDLNSVQWVPVVTLSICIYIYTNGIGSLSYVLLADLLSNEVRSFGSMIIIFFQNFTTFILLRLFEPVSVAYGRHVFFYFFGSCMIVSGILIKLFLQETKGKDAQEIFDSNYNFKKKIYITS